jgi:hypothetical protein
VELQSGPDVTKTGLPIAGAARTDAVITGTCVELASKIQKLLKDANELIDTLRTSDRTISDVELHLLETEIHILQLEIARLKLDRAMRQGRKD